MKVPCQYKKIRMKTLDQFNNGNPVHFRVTQCVSGNLKMNLKWCQLDLKYSDTSIIYLRQWYV